MNYKISNAAKLDLEEIWLYTKQNWSPDQADHYLNLIFDEIEYLCKNPKSGMNVGKTRKGYFRSKVKSHLIFYRVNTRQNELGVIRILHQHMEIENRLDD